MPEWTISDNLENHYLIEECPFSIWKNKYYIPSIFRYYKIWNCRNEDDQLLQMQIEMEMYLFPKDKLMYITYNNDDEKYMCEITANLTIYENERTVVISAIRCCIVKVIDDDIIHEAGGVDVYKKSVDNFVVKKI